MGVVIRKLGRPMMITGLVVVLLNGLAGAETPAVETEAWRNLDPERASVSVVTGDVDLDGDLDLIFASSGGEVALYPNNFGRLSSRVPVWESSTGQASLTKVVLGDVNGDGFPELICASESAPLVVFWNSGGNFLSPPDSFGPILPVKDLALADLDNDEDLDLILACDGVANRWLRNEDGILHETPIIIGDVDKTLALAVGDIDGDGWLDIFMANSQENDGRHQVLFNRAGDLTAEVFSFQESGTPGATAIGDISGDGLMDIVIAVSPVWIKTFINNGDLTFSADPVDIGAGTVTDLALVDIDSDGLLDIICTTESSTAPVKWVKNLGGSWAAVETLGSLDIVGGMTSLALGDLDEDGDLDISGAAKGGSADAVLWLAGGILETRASWPPTGSFAADDNNTTYGLALVDLDKDNDLDIVQARRAGNNGERNAIYINQGGVISSAPDQWTAVETIANSLHVTDWDRDGYPDLLFGNEIQPIHLHRNLNGTIDPNPEPLAAQGATVWSLAAVDLDNDGHDDLVEGRIGELKVSFRDAAGDGFRESLVLGSDLPGNYFNYLDFADVDNDGDLDIASALSPGLDVVFRNNFNDETAGASLDTMWISPASHSGGFVSLNDINNDGQPDLTLGYAGGAVDNEWFLGNSSGFDQLGRRWGSNTHPTWQVEMSDWDGDGYEDFLEAEEGGPNLLMGNRAGNIDQSDRPLWASEDSSNTFRLVAGDLDGDGDLDLLVGNKSNPDQIFRGVINPGPTNPEGIAPPEMPGSPAYLQKLSSRVENPNEVIVSCEAVDRQGDQLYILGRCRPVSSPTWFEVEPRLLTATPDGEPHQMKLNSSAWPSSPGGYILQLRSVEISRRLPVAVHAPRYEVRLPSAGIKRPEARLSSHEMVIPTLTEGGAAASELRITNTGNDHLLIEGESSRGDLVLSPTSATVAPGETLSMIMELSPIDTLQHRQVIITSNDPLSQADTVMVTTDILALDFEFNFLLEGGTETAPLGESLTGLLAPRDGVDMEEGWLYYRQSGMTSFTALPLSPLSSLEKDWVAVIPGQQVTENGIEYYLAVRNGDKTVTDPRDAPDSRLHRMEVEPPTRMTSLVQAHSDAGILTGRDVFIRVVPPPGTLLTEGAVHFRVGGEEEFQMVPLQADSTALIPSSAVGERGLEYHVEAQSQSDVLLRDPPEGENQIRVNVQDLAEPQAAGPRQYRMVSVPLDFGDFSGTIGALLTDQPEFGPYGITRWRCFRYLAGNKRYGELSETGLANEFTPVPGRAFWLIGAQSNRLRTAPVSGRTVPIDRSYVVTVPPGWTQVGNPFSFPVSWDGVSVTDTFGVAADDLLVGPLSGSHKDLSVLQPFGGFWVKNLHEEDLLQIHFPPKAHVGEKESDSPGGLLEWSVTLDASSGEAGSSSAQVAIAPSSLVAWDPMDTPLPPSAPGRSLRVFLVNDSWPVHSGSYIKDVRPETGQGQTWPFEIDLVDAEPGEVVEAQVTFGNLPSLPEKMSAVLLDRELHQVIPLTRETRYPLLAKASGSATAAGRFMLAIGTREFLDQSLDDLVQLPPSKTVLMQNAPNPFNPSTVLHYELAVEGPVRLNVYDVRGQRIRELVSQRQAAGRYRVMWDGRDGHGAGAGAGVYFARLETQNGAAMTIKMILVK